MNKYISKKEIKDNNLNIFKVTLSNILFIKKELEISKELLDNINGYSLDINQRKAVIINEENNLVIAGAGSGKTLTIVGKIRYLIERQRINKDEILCISFTNDSVNSLKKALIKNYNYDIDVLTFHKLSLNIIKNNNKNISICNNNLLDYITDEFFLRNITSYNIINSDSYKQLKTLIITFINLFKSNNYNDDYFINILKKCKNKKEKILINIIKIIYFEYQSELKSTLKVDFNDMINSAIKIINNNGYIKPYKYIIIDEYQDTSYTKYLLIKEIKKVTNAKLFVVGDDFQSIYRFTGCNLDIFLKFKKYYGYSKTIRIVNTYRNSNELIFIAGSFIMKNKKQLKKRLISNKNINKPIEIIYSSNEKEDLFKLLNSINTNILLLGRNNKDIYKYFTKIDEKGYIEYKNKKVRFLTVHKSKGLEEDNVIIINNEDSILGFPSKIQNNKL